MVWYLVNHNCKLINYNYILISNSNVKHREQCSRFLIFCSHRDSWNNIWAAVAPSVISLSTEMSCLKVSYVTFTALVGVYQVNCQANEM